jgi:hypothetical protein
MCCATRGRGGGTFVGELFIYTPHNFCGTYNYCDTNGKRANKHPRNFSKVIHGIDLSIRRSYPLAFYYK